MKTLCNCHKGKYIDPDEDYTIRRPMELEKDEVTTDDRCIYCGYYVLYDNELNKLSTDDSFYSASSIIINIDGLLDD